MRQLAENAGEDGSVVVDEALGKKQNEGFNALTGEWVDMFKAGIVDPTKVVRCALQNAASIAGLMLTTNTMVTSIPDEKKAVEGSTS
jgi:chaperonin GroEL